ncbi:hypothetical protein Fot_32346 [Forsythia ovata]|uniref:Uncharacterized protein n=1 Tax=Forsythia ovata TaxID=205694 RepID=A0ABD1T7J4_9LAMI
MRCFCVITYVLPLNPISIVYPVVEADGGVLSSFLLVIEVRDDSSSPPSVVEVRNDSSSIPSESSTSSSVDVQHQDKGKGIAVGKGENVASKRGLEGEDAVADSGKIKKSRMALHQEILDSVPASSIAVQDPFLIRLTGRSVSTLGLVKMN